MADPFEVRIKFTHQLQHLNASVNSAQKAAHYAIKHKEMDEDLHSCIIEQLERNNMNNRANIMYFLDSLCEMAQREKALQFVDFIRRDILRVVDAVAPADGSGAANVKVVRRVLSGLQSKAVLTLEAVTELEQCLKERDIAAAHPALSPGANGDETTSPGGAVKQNGGGTWARPDKRQIEQRIEEDRERHKRLRESIWAVGNNDREEFEQMWDDASDIGEDDFLVAQEESEERRRAAEIDV